MAGDVRGHDVESWWKNRRLYRDDATTQADQLRMAGENFSHASDGAPVALIGQVETVPNPVQVGQALLVQVKGLKQQLPVLDAERQQARSNFSREENTIGADCHRRVQGERDEALRKARQAAELAEKSKVLVRKIAAAVIFIAILYVLAEY